MLTIGADPEVWIADKNNRIVSAEGLIPGTKDKPHRVTDGAIQVDGLAAEFNIDPANSAEEFAYKIDIVKKQLMEFLNKKGDGYKLVFADTVKFEPKYFKEIPKKSLEVGCDPDFMALNREERERPVPKLPGTYRYAGGHIHVGGIYTEDMDEFQKREKRLHLMRYFSPNGYLNIISKGSHLTNAAVHQNLNDTSNNKLYKEGCTRMQQVYGAYRTYRPKPYGIEIRYFSNVWAENKEKCEKIYNYVMNKSLRAMYSYNPNESSKGLSRSIEKKIDQIAPMPQPYRGSFY